jgi:uncharacterized membrane protein
MSGYMLPPELEARLQAMEARLAALDGQAAAPELAPLPTPARARASSPSPSPSPFRWNFLDSSEGWLGRVGVMLLVVGMILLFRYAVQRGWLTPEMRVVIGLVVGAGLLGAGAFFFTGRRLYRQILMGGGIVILFITGLAATELYQLISESFALVFFAVVAGTAFRIASRLNESVIASIGAAGALVPPSILLADTLPGPVLWWYLAIVITWTGVLMTLRGWERPLLFAALLSVLALLHNVPATFHAQAAAIVALSVCWLCYAALPLARARLLPADAAPLSLVSLLVLPSLVTLALGYVADEFVKRGGHAFEVSTAIAAIGFAALAIWLKDHVDAKSAAFCAFVVALAAASMATVEAPWMFATAASIAAFAKMSTNEADVRFVDTLAHAMFAGLAVAFLVAIERFVELSAFDTYAVAFMIVTAVASVVAYGLDRREERVVYLVGIFVATHVLMATELSAIAAAPWLASVGYGVAGSVLLIWGLSRKQVAVQRAGMISLALLVARLFLFDLAQVDVGVRIVLFMVFGFAFLGLSYFVKAQTLHSSSMH